jgi:CMP-N,N'-diacetyllegionaminic acid synthase
MSDINDKKKLYVGLIPARSGSKGIIKKNLKLVLGKPLVQHTIDAAKKSNLLDKIYLSTDDPKIIKIADTNEIISIDRPKNFSKDTSPMSEVINHFIKNYVNNDLSHRTNIVLMQPTSPLRNNEDIDNAIALHLKSNKDTLVSVRNSKEVVHKSFYLNSDGFLETLFPEEKAHYRRQDLPKTFHPNGAIYIFSLKSFLEQGDIPLNFAIPFVMDELNSIDIDTIDDVSYLEYLWRLKNE